MYTLSNPEGKLSLTYHDPKGWATETYVRLVALGCSVEYARKVARRIERAKVVV